MKTQMLFKTATGKVELVQLTDFHPAEPSRVGSLVRLEQLVLGAGERLFLTE